MEVGCATTRARRWHIRVVAGAMLCMSTGVSLAQGQNLITNGGFEDPLVDGPFVQRLPGSIFGGWQVDQFGQGIVHVASYGEPLAIEGAQCVELNYFLPGSISQTITTVPNRLYVINFLIAGQLNAGPDMKQMRIDIDGMPLITLDWSRNATGGQWVRRDVYFTANGAQTVVRFVGITAVDGGPYLDDVSIRPLETPCPADFNADGVLNSDDLSDYITAYFSEPPDPAADFNGDGAINSDDLSDYITAYFDGC
jgi:hypothetical protein